MNVTLDQFITKKSDLKALKKKKSLELLLKEKSLDPAKLKQFCLRFAVPHAYRCLLWKLLLGIIPMQVDCHAFVMSQRKQEYNDLYHTLLVTRIVEDKTAKCQVFLAMWLMQTGNLSFDLNLLQEKEFSTSSFVAIVKCLAHFFDDDIDIYWIAKFFYENGLKMRNDIPRLIDVTHNLLEKEDPELYRTLINNSIIENLPLAKWFDCCFAGIFNENCIIKIWDKICGGSYKILAYLVVFSLIALKQHIIKMNDVAGIMQYIKNISEETAEVIVNKTIEKWQLYGSPLTVQDKPKTTNVN